MIARILVVLALCSGGLAAAISLPSALAQQAPKKKAPAKDAKKPEKPVIYRIGDLTLSEVWFHQSASRNGTAFLKIKNASEDDDSLIDASTPVAERVELHGPANSRKEGQTSRVNLISVPAGQQTTLTGTALHLKLTGLRGALKADEKVPITLTFERAGAITVTAKVLSPEEAAARIEKLTPKKATPKEKLRRRRQRR